MDINKQLIAYSPIAKLYEHTPVTDSFSEINKILLSSWKYACDNKKVFTFGYPSFKTPNFPVILYDTAKYLDKDILFITANPEHYLEQYELLGQKSGRYLYNDCIPILINGEHAEVRLIPQRIPKKRKLLDMGVLFDESKESSKRKIIFCNYLFFPESMTLSQETFFQDLAKSSNLPIDLGAVFFDNLDLNYHENLEKFAKWAENLSSSGRNVFIKIFNVYSTIPETLKQESNGIKITYNHPLFIKYHEMFKGKLTRYDLLPKILGSSNIGIENIGNPGNLDELKKELDNNYYSLKRDFGQIPEFIRPIINLKNKLPCLFIHPSDFKFAVVDENGNWTSVNVIRYIEMLETIIKKEDVLFKDQLKNFLTTFKTYYKELEETYRHGQTHHYSKKCKNSFLMNLLLEKDSKKELNKINIIVFSERGEKNLLKRDIEELKLKNIEVKVFTFNESAKEDYLDGETYLPGIPYKISDLIKLKYTCEKLNLIIYEGEQLNNFEEKVSQIEDSVYVKNSLIEIKDNSDLEIFNIKEFPQTIKLIEWGGVVKDRLYREEEEELENPFYFEKNIERYNVKKANDYDYHHEPQDNTLHIEDINAREVVSINCGQNTLFYSIDKDGNYSTLTFLELNVGDTIMKFGSSGEEDLLSIISNIYGLEDSVDIDIIRSWKRAFQNWIRQTKERINLRGLYQKYVDNCSENNTKAKTEPAFHGWVYEKRIGPGNEEDVLILGLLSNFPDIKKEYKFIFEQMAHIRNAHMMVGRKISKIIKYLILKEEHKNLDFQEQILLDKIHIFKILSKRMGNSESREKLKGDTSLIKKEKNIKLSPKSKPKGTIKKNITPEEHERRVKILKDAGLLKS